MISSWTNLMCIGSEVYTVPTALSSVWIMLPMDPQNDQNKAGEFTDTMGTLVRLSPTMKCRTAFVYTDTHGHNIHTHMYHHTSHKHTCLHNIQTHASTHTHTSKRKTNTDRDVVKWTEWDTDIIGKWQKEITTGTGRKLEDESPFLLQ